jgi:hypothetical protein
MAALTISWIWPAPTYGPNRICGTGSGLASRHGRKRADDDGDSSLIQAPTLSDCGTQNDPR